jgi:hypothetical protein
VVNTPIPENENFMATALEPKITHKKAVKMPTKKEKSLLWIFSLSIAPKNLLRKKIFFNIDSKKESESLYQVTLNSNGIRSDNRGAHEKFKRELNFLVISLQLPIEL